MPTGIIALCIFLLMLPVTAMVPVLKEITQGRYPELSDFDKHLFMSANMLGALLFAPLAGLLSDWLRRRKGLILAALIVNGLSLHLLLGEWSYPVYLGWRFLEGCAHITALSLLMALAADHAKQSRLGGSMGLIGAAVSLGVATGAPLGGVVGDGDPEAVFRYGAWLLVGLALVCLVALRDLPPAPRRLGAATLLTSLRRNRRLLIPYAFAFVDRLTVGFIVSTLSLYLGGRLGLSAKEIGLVMALFLIPFALLTYPSALLARHWDKLRMMVAGSLLYGVVLSAIGFASPQIVYILMTAGGVVAALMYAPSLIMVAELAGPHHKAIAMGGFNFAGSLGFVIGPLAGGALVTLFAASGWDPYRIAFVIIGGLEVLCAVLFAPMVLRPAPAPAGGVADAEVGAGRRPSL